VLEDKMKITEKIVDINTGEEQIVEREATLQEIEEIEAAKKQAVERQLRIDSEKKARLEVLQKLGITEEEAKLLLS
jgi:hypothetical protein